MSTPHLIIDANKTESHYWQDIWRYRELFVFLSWRDLLVRYKQTVIGILWAVIRPVLTSIIFTIIFGRFAKLPSDGMPYVVFVFAAMLPWQFFSTSLSEGSNSLIGNANMISKIYFPRVVLPVSTLVVNLVDFLISFVILIGLMVWQGIPITVKLFAIAPFILLASVSALGCSLWLSALNVKYRDFRYIVPFIVQFGLYVSPVIFSTSTVPQQWRLLFDLNPMVAVIDGFRWAVSGGVAPLTAQSLSCGIGMSLSLLFSGLFYFRRTEKTFADVI